MNIITGWKATVLAASLLACISAQAEWHPLEVEVWEPPFNLDRQRSSTTYQALTRATGDWRICVVIPHLKDAYWLAVNYGLVAEAQRLGVAISLYEAGGYERQEVQRQQVERCLDEGFDGLIISAIATDGLNDLLVRAARDAVPVVDLINGMAPGNLTARVAVDFWDNGRLTGNYLSEKHGTSSALGRLAWFPGPAGAGWVAAGDAGFREALAGTNLEIVASRYGDTGRVAQRQLIEAVLDETPDIDYLVGTAVTAEAAVEVLRSRGLANQIQVMAYYYSPGVHRAIRRGSIMAAPSDQQALLARMAVDVMVRILEGSDYHRHVAPPPVLIDQSVLAGWDESTSLPPRGFRPIFSVSH